MKVVIIGAGAAGLVACKTLLESATPDFPFDPVILEQEEDIGGSLKQSHALLVILDLGLYGFLFQEPFDIARIRYVCLGLLRHRHTTNDRPTGRTRTWCHRNRQLSWTLQIFMKLRILLVNIFFRLSFTPGAF